MANLILIPGSGHGGWWFDPIVGQLEALGHRVIAVTLTGLDNEKVAQGAVNLDTHIQDVLEVIEQNELEEFFLIAHSYGGIVSTGVADKTKANVQGLSYLDAILPQSGERLWDLISVEMQNGFLADAHDGLNSYPPAEYLALQPRVMPHPLGTMLQPLHYSATVFNAPVKVYVFAEKFFGIPEMLSPFKAIYDRLSEDPSWTTYSLPLGHDVVVEAPDRIVELINSAVKN